MSVFKRERLAEMAANAAASHARSVLIVDDEEGNLRVLRAMLDGKYRIQEAHDGKEALDWLESVARDEQPAVILSDQRMPNMTGVELFEEIRDRLPQTIRIIITGFVDVGAIVDSINRAGIYKFIVKPFDRDDLLITVDRAVEAFELRRQVDDYVHQLEAKVRERTAELESKNEALKLANAEIEKVSLSDPLTGLGNRRFLARTLNTDEAEGERANRRHSGGQRTAFLLVDVDHFKLVNDTHGHAAGDAVLTTLAEVLRRHCREGDTAARWGGEEFILKIAVEDENQALGCASRLRQAVAATVFSIGNGESLRKTCSIGVACLPFDVTAPMRLNWEHVVAVADAALYMAKRNGRNAAYCLSPVAGLPADFELRLTTDIEAFCRDGVLRVARDSAV